MSQVKLSDPIKGNLLAENPWLESTAFVQDLIKELGKKEANSRLKVTFLAYDSNSPYTGRGLTEKEVMHDISNYVLKKPRYDWDKVTDVKKYWLNKICSASEALLRTYKNQLDQIYDQLEKLGEGKTSVTNLKDRVTLLKSMKTLADDFIELERKVKQDNKDALGMGNYDQSLVESGA